MSRRGFTLIELMMALAVASIGFVAAANITTWALRKSGRGEQKTQLLDRARLVEHQILTDLAGTGYGSTGAIAVPCAKEGVWGDVVHELPSFCHDVPGTDDAYMIPAFRVADNVSGLSPIRDGTDVLMVVVPDPGSATLLDEPADDELKLRVRGVPARFGSDPTCRFVYLVDHSNPNGAGRAMLLRNASDDDSSVTLGDPLQFPITTGTEVMCARVSSYWVDEAGNLRRSDLDFDIEPISANANRAGVLVTPAADGSDILSPGVEDFQVAVRFSAALGTGEGRSFAYAKGSDEFDNFVNDVPNAWFEARMVDFQILMRSLRRVEVETGALVPEQIGNAPAPRAIPVTYGRTLVQGTAELTNLRLFDQNSEQGTEAKPW